MNKAKKLKGSFPSPKIEYLSILIVVQITYLNEGQVVVEQW